MERRITVGETLISLVAAFTAVSPFLADFDTTHVYNPYRPGHAKFHNGQTMTLGLMSGFVSLYFLWLKRTSTYRENLKVACLFAVLYWLAMAPAILYPGATLSDPQQGGRVPGLIFGFTFTQLHTDAIIFAVLLLSYRADSGRGSLRVGVIDP